MSSPVEHVWSQRLHPDRFPETFQRIHQRLFASTCEEIAELDEEHMFPSCLYTNRVEDRSLQSSQKQAVASLECTETAVLECDGFGLGRSKPSLKERLAEDDDPRPVEVPQALLSSPTLGRQSRKDVRRVARIELPECQKDPGRTANAVEELEVTGLGVLTPGGSQPKTRMLTEETTAGKSDTKDSSSPQFSLLKPVFSRSMRETSPTSVARLGSTFSCNNLFAKQLKKCGSSDKSISSLFATATPGRPQGSDEPRKDLSMAFKRCKSPSGRPSNGSGTDSTLRSARMKDRLDTDTQSFSRVSSRHWDGIKKSTKLRMAVTPTSLSSCQSAKTFYANMIRPPEDVWVSDKSRPSLE